MLEGCDHCGTVLRRTEDDAASCPECGRSMRTMDAYEAQVLARERRVAEQFRRTNRLRPAAEMGQGLRV